jgi:tetraether lipid synthase
VQHDLDKLGIAKNSGEEELRAGAAKIKQDEENARMARLYRQHVLQEQPQAELVTLDAIKPAAQPVAQVEEREEVGSFGD